MLGHGLGVGKVQEWGGLILGIMLMRCINIYVQHINLHCVKGLQCSFPLSLLIFMHLMMGLSTCKYEPF